MNYACSQGSDNVSGKGDQSDHIATVMRVKSQSQSHPIPLVITTAQFFCRDNVSRKHGKSDHYNDKGVHT